MYKKKYEPWGGQIPPSLPSQIHTWPPIGISSGGERVIVGLPMGKISRV
jgi:hypothetical protein